MTSTAPETQRGQDAGDPLGEEPTSWQRRLRRFGHVPRPETPLRDRLDPPYTRPGRQVWSVFAISPALADRLVRWSGWGGPLLVALVAGVLRFWKLDQPHAVIFDETYYAKDAWALVNQGYEGSWPKDVDKLILKDPSSVPIPTDPGYVVHPPVGKWVIGFGEQLFGFTPFGWRFMVAVLGTLSVLMLCRIGRRLFRSTFLGCLAGLLLAVDGLHFVMSRTALLDLIVMFFVLAAFGCLVVDRDHARRRLAAALPVDEEGVLRPDARIAETLRLGWRPWRLAAGVMLGLAFATKWNGLYVLAAFGLMTVLWDVGARRTAGAAKPYLAVLRRDLVPAFVSTVPVAIVTYLVSWTGWIVTDKGYYRNWAATEGKDSGWSWLLPDWLRSLWHYETQVYDFHVGLTSGHTYESNPWSWLVLGRPVSYFYEEQTGCQESATGKCAAEVLAIGTPLLWWLACVALAYVVWRWLFRRDWRAGAIACGVAAGWLPWFFYQERTIFLFYAVVFVPFLCLAVTMLLGAIIGPAAGKGTRAELGLTTADPTGERRRTLGAIAAGVLVLLIIWNFIYFYPLYTGTSIPEDLWRDRMWLDTWV
ncbi:MULTISPECIES: dolichyl-phosphate-mannose--protein mannosyltransferase [Streptomyces]|uniref:Polyprenol-phosphate-mannose--protein mannosyltransferase n=1 Tax=Streptomyces cavourensis TaxID=67258 RepID=A0ABY5FFR5_9ACTN|nr:MULTISPECIES: phospholipid carrier-dependent glycosyltransferase [Streptomyces]NUW20206.1 phospholipid carrier-dependent glycosyltransferase [Streptomyces roseoviolaceus]ATY96201.1 phospholipid carrier-dependent glycosyltransferase [Streptomyces cavourensis]MBH0241702.1 phospholipid carrier-dependent glycosyltransferase [Streptomyces cavourensis]NUV39352.1 phospholipid carrier-dependent glycosyltransferase [Streptomyces sp. CAI-24]NUV87862.1 phospholipid carrier-dependent glycosyltransferas